jgi:drug/metabolite transporter (DMT)-like permease
MSVTSRKPLDGLAMGLMCLLCATWGMQQVAIKAAASDLHPVLQNGLRSVIAAVLILGLMGLRGERLSLSDSRLPAGLSAGLLFAGEFVCVALGLTYTSASHMAVFLYTAPVFGALGLHFFVPGEHLSPRQWLGVLLAFFGIAFAFSNGLAGGGASHDMLIGDALGVLGGLLWAGATLVVRKTSLSEAPPTLTLLYQLLVTAALQLGIATFNGQWAAVHMSGIAWTSLIFQRVIVAFASYLAWYWLLRKYLASRLSAFSFLTPLFGVSFGVLLLSDPLDPRFIAGAVLVFAGLVLVNLRGR